MWAVCQASWWEVVGLGEKKGVDVSQKKDRGSSQYIGWTRPVSGMVDGMLIEIVLYIE